MKHLLMAILLSFISNVVTAQEKPAWQVQDTYDSLPCFSLQETQTLKRVRNDGVEEIVKEADIFHENTKKFFQKHRRFICPPVLDKNLPSEQKITRGKLNNFEVIEIVHPWQMDIVEGTAKGEIWKIKFDAESGVGRGKNKRHTEFTVVPLVPRHTEQSPFLIHSMKLRHSDKELVRVCYPVKKQKECNPYPVRETQEVPPESNEEEN